MKIKARSKKGVAKIKLLAKHPMESGLRKDRKGKTIPAHFIETLTVHQGNDQVFVANLGPAISKNPYLSFSLNGINSGTELSFKWVDNQGKSESKLVKIK